MVLTNCLDLLAQGFNSLSASNTPAWGRIPCFLLFSNLVLLCHADTDDALVLVIVPRSCVKSSVFPFQRFARYILMAERALLDGPVQRSKSMWIPWDGIIGFIAIWIMLGICFRVSLPIANLLLLKLNHPVLATQVSLIKVFGISLFLALLPASVVFLLGLAQLRQLQTIALPVLIIVVNPIILSRMLRSTVWQTAVVFLVYMFLFLPVGFSVLSFAMSLLRYLR